jgi:hypothetical protein
LFVSCRSCPGSLSLELSAHLLELQVRSSGITAFSSWWSLELSAASWCYRCSLRNQVLIFFFISQIDPNAMMSVSKVCSSPCVHCDCSWHFEFIFLQFHLSADLPRWLSLSSTVSWEFLTVMMMALTFLFSLMFSKSIWMYSDSLSTWHLSSSYSYLL